MALVKVVNRSERESWLNHGNRGAAILTFFYRPHKYYFRAQRPRQKKKKKKNINQEFIIEKKNNITNGQDADEL